MDKNEIIISSLTWREMVHEFSEQCRKYEKWVEQRYEFDSHNRSIRSGVRDRIIEEVNKLAFAMDAQKLERRDELFEKSANSYDPQNKYEDYLNKESNARSSSFFLAKQIYDELTLENGCEPVKSKGEIDRLVRNKIEYLSVFFGVNYNQDEWSEEQWFQIHQLLLILYRCANIKAKILDGMSKSAIWRFQDRSENPYQKGINFIRGELLKGISFSVAVDCECFAGKIRHAVHSMADGIVRMVADNRLNKADLPIEEIQNDLYPLILKNLEKLNKGENRKICFDGVENIFVRAYLHFLFLGIEDTISTPYLELERKTIDLVKQVHAGSLQEEWPERESGNRRSGITQDEIKNDEVGVKVGDQIDYLEQFIQDEANIIVKKLLEMTDPQRIATIRRYNNKKIYLTLAQMYFRYNLYAKPYVISLSELLAIICLYHECIKQEPADKFIVPRENDYKGGNTTRSENKIKTIVSKIAGRENSVDYMFFFGTKEERAYDMECFMNTLNAILNEEPAELMEYGHRIEKETFAYFLTNVNDRHFDLNAIALSIFSVKEMEGYADRKEEAFGRKLFYRND